MKIDHFDPPGNIDDFGNEASLKQQWSSKRSGIFDLSIARLRTFVAANPVSFILGSHIEMTNQPGNWFGLPAFFQPDEHVLQLEQRHLFELYNALKVIGAHPRTDRHADFIIYPAGEPFPPLRA